MLGLAKREGLDCLAGWRGGSAQFGGDHPDVAGSGGLTECGAGAARGGVDGYRGAGFGGCAVAFAGGEGDEFGADDGELKEAGYWLIGVWMKARRRVIRRRITHRGGDCARG